MDILFVELFFAYIVCVGILLSGMLTFRVLLVPLLVHFCSIVPVAKLPSINAFHVVIILSTKRIPLHLLT